MRECVRVGSVTRVSTSSLGASSRGFDVGFLRNLEDIREEFRLKAAILRLYANRPEVVTVLHPEPEEPE
jgi:hypothetical protein